MAPDHRCRGRGAPQPRRAQRVRPGPVCRPRPCAAAAAGRPQPENKPSRRTLITDDNRAGTTSGQLHRPATAAPAAPRRHAARHAAAAGRGALARGAGRVRGRVPGRSALMPDMQHSGHVRLAFLNSHASLALPGLRSWRGENHEKSLDTGGLGCRRRRCSPDGHRVLVCQLVLVGLVTAVCCESGRVIRPGPAAILSADPVPDGRMVR